METNEGSNDDKQGRQRKQELNTGSEQRNNRIHFNMKVLYTTRDHETGIVTVSLSRCVEACRTKDCGSKS